MSEIYQYAAGTLAASLGCVMILWGIRSFDHLKTILSGLVRYSPSRLRAVHAYQPRHSKGSPHWSKAFTR